MIARKHEDVAISMFEAINKAADHLQDETLRIVCGKKLRKTLTCGELQIILDGIKTLTEELKKVTFKY